MNKHTRTAFAPLLVLASLVGGCGQGSSWYEFWFGAGLPPVSADMRTANDGAVLMMDFSVTDLATGQDASPDLVVADLTGVDGLPDLGADASLADLFAGDITAAQDLTVVNEDGPPADLARVDGSPDQVSGDAGLDGGVDQKDGGPLPAPTVTKVEPVTGPSSGGTVVTITGTGFQQGASVTFDGLPSPSIMWVSTMVMNVKSPAHACGKMAVDVVVKNPDGQIGGLGKAFTYACVLSMLPQPEIKLAGTPSAFAIDDWNKDGKVDLAVTASAGNSFTVMTGKGDGSFAFGVTTATGKTPIAVVTGDWKGDGNPDLVIVNQGDNNVSLFSGKGDGTWNAAQNTLVGTNLRSIVGGDWNGDAKQDLAVVSGGSIITLQGDGNGAFGMSKMYAANATPNAIVVATVAATGDWNKDGKVDLAVINEANVQGVGSKAVGVLLNKGDGTFHTAVQYSDLASGGGTPHNLVAMDFDQDTNPDIVVSWGSGSGFNGASLLRGKGDGTFTKPAQMLVAKNLGSDAAFGLTGADYDLNGMNDVVITNTNGTLSLFLGMGGGLSNPVGIQVGPGPKQVASPDLNGDGKPDLVVLTQAGVVTVLNKGQ